MTAAHDLDRVTHTPDDAAAFERRHAMPRDSYDDGRPTARELAAEAADDERRQRR